jgi:hypothetical protein
MRILWPKKTQESNYVELQLRTVVEETLHSGVCFYGCIILELCFSYLTG